MKGYTGRALFVDLTSGEVTTQEIPEEWFEDYVGGEGVAVRLFHDLMDADIDAFDPAQPLIFATGPLTGTPAPASGRWNIVFRSPATGTLGLSNAGGKLAPQIKRAGWDLIVIRGQAEKPVYITIRDEQVNIYDASDLWGKGVDETEDLIQDELDTKGFQIASIGPAGENRVLFAAVMNDKHRAAGRGGAGALMGSKNLKAIAIKGTKAPAIADPDTLKERAAAARKELFEETFVADELAPFGTPSFYDAIDALGILPTKNWQRTTFPEGLETLGHEAYHETLDVKPYACYGCPIGCGRVTTIKEGPYSGMHGGGPEYETVAAFGSKCMVIDLNAVAAANHLSNDLGLDVISTGQVIATAMEWYEDGLIDDEDTEALDLSWGNGDAVVEMVKRIAHRDGLGDLLADGVKRAAEKIGPEAEKAAMHVKGLEMAADGVRASKGESLSHTTSARGADHLRPYASAIEAFGYREPELGIEQEVDYLEDGKKEWVKPLQELSMATNMLGVCLFTSITLAIKPSTWASLLSAAVGRTMTKEDLLRAAERVINLERMINASLGFNRADDKLPVRFLREPAPDGRGEGQTVDLDVTLESYYASMGWNMETGLPTPKTLEELGLEWLV
jgi:aldehyde:ferredoxin oxidoreductase